MAGAASQDPRELRPDGINQPQDGPGVVEKPPVYDSLKSSGEPQGHPQGPSQVQYTGDSMPRQGIDEHYAIPDNPSSSSTPLNLNQPPQVHLRTFSQPCQGIDEHYTIPTNPFSSSTPLNPNQPPHVHPRTSSQPRTRRHRWPHQDSAGHCMHSVLVIQHSTEENDLKCDRCHCDASMGWLYRCVVDDYDAGFVDDEATLLSPWIRKAIEDGKYTEEQIHTLYIQKLDVLDGVDTWEDTNRIMSGAGWDNDYANAVIERVPSESEDGTSAGSAVVHSMYRKRPPCNIHVCHNCRPYIERAYISLNRVCNEEKFELPTRKEARDLPVIDRDILCNMKLDRPPFWTFGREGASLDEVMAMGQSAYAAAQPRNGDARNNGAASIICSTSNAPLLPVRAESERAASESGEEDENDDVHSAKTV